MNKETNVLNRGFVVVELTHGQIASCDRMRDADFAYIRYGTLGRVLKSRFGTQGMATMMQVLAMIEEGKEITQGGGE